MDQYEQNKWKLETDFDEYNFTGTFSGPVYSTQDCFDLFGDIEDVSPLSVHTEIKKTA